MNNDDPLDVTRVALAVDAMTVGTPGPILVHAETDPAVDPPERPFGLFLTPLAGLETLDDALVVLQRITVPRRWCLAGLSAPTVLRLPNGTADADRTYPAWFIAVLTGSGARATRLAVPGAPEVSGPADELESADRIDRCLRHLLGIAPQPGAAPHRSSWAPTGRSPRWR